MTTSRPVAVVTGGSQGIGRRASEELARDGWSVALCSRREEDARAVADELASAYGGPTLGIAADVVSVADLERFAAHVTTQLGPPDVVLANAGVPGPVGPLWQVDLRAWADAVMIDLAGVANTFAVFGRGMVERGRGSLITMSGGGVGGPSLAQRMSAYTSSKAAIAVLTEVAALELTEHGVRVNAIAPGAIATRFMEPVLAAGPNLAGESFYQQTVRQREMPDSLDGFAALLRLLAAPDGPWITGRVLSARWDDPARLRADPPSPTSSLYRLRRIDGSLFAEVGHGS